MVDIDNESACFSFCSRPSFFLCLFVSFFHSPLEHGRSKSKCVSASHMALEHKVNCVPMQFDVAVEWSTEDILQSCIS